MLQRRGRGQPVRTCVGCRERAVAAELLRIVADGDQLVLDRHARMAGRGAHLHPTLDCLEAAERRKAFPRALRVPGPLDATPVRRLLQPASSSEPESRSWQPNERSMSSPQS